MTSYRTKLIILLTGILIVTFFVYKGGLNGGFIFDDYNNLNKLNGFQNEITLEKLQRYVGESGSGPLKRPISIFSFLVDAQEWPTEAYSFKRTNLIIHLINGGLLYFLLVILFRYKGFSVNKRLYIAGFSAFMWMAHPFLVSTTLYVVQRMAMLPLMFMLLGFVIYLIARRRYHISDGAKGYILMFVAVYVMTFLAVLSKENGVVFIWLVALFEVFIIQRYLHFRPLPKTMSFWLLKLPSFALLVIFIIQIPGFIIGYDVREYNMEERLMTQSRAVSKYIYHLFLPGYFTEGVFTDGFKYSTSIIKPLSTLFGLIFVVGLLVIAWIKRKKWIWFSFAVFFFFIAQILESTVVPLELYYEHRVYIASLFLPLLLVLMIIKLSNQSKVVFIIPLLLSFLLAGMTYMRSDIWSNNLQLHELTMNKFPESVRARVSTASIYEQAGLMGDAISILDRGRDIHNNLELEFNRVALYCHLEMIEYRHVNEVSELIENIPFVKNDQRPFINLIRIISANQCLGEDSLKAVKSIAESGKNNPNSNKNYLKSLLLFIQADVARKQGFYDQAEHLYIESFELSQTEYRSMNTAIMGFVSDKQFNHAERILDYERQIYQKEYKYKYDWLKYGEMIEGFQELIRVNKNAEKTDNNNTGKE